MNAARLFEDLEGGFGAARHWQWGRPLIVDSFAGGGGASTGIEMALGRSPDIAINHDADALAMHQVNHPDTLHLSKNVWQVDPLGAVGNRRVGLAWFSPDCKHFSKAKGGRPVKRNIRDLAWVVVLWAKRVRPEVIILENVEEFRDWGPVLPDGKPCPERKGKIFEQWTRELKRCGYKIEWRELRACDYGAPTIRKRFFMIARRDGRPIVWPEPTHGAPDDPDVIAGKKLPWRTAAEIIDWSIPCPSIFDTSEEILAKFGVRAIRPLADATMKRIARGVVRYVLEAKKPFIVEFGQRIDRGDGTQSMPFTVSPVVTYGQQGGGNRAADVPIHTITASPKDQNAIIVPSFVGCGGRAGQSAPRGGDQPLGTQTAKADGCVVAAHLTAYCGERTGCRGRVGEASDALQTHTVGGNRHAAIAALLRSADRPLRGRLAIGKASHQRDKLPDGRSADEDVNDAGKRCILAAEDRSDEIKLEEADQPPIDPADDDEKERDDVDRAHGEDPCLVGRAPKTAATENCSAVFFAQHNNDNRRIGGVNPGRPADEPLATLTASGAQQQVVAAFMSRQFGASVGHGLDEPSATDTAGVNKSALIAGFLMKYYGTGGQWAPLGQPAHTDTTKDRQSLVTVEIDGETYAIADIGMRMLTPRERFRAQGFPDSYIIDRRPDGSPITQTVQGRCCGNSVCPPLAKALVAANCGHLAEERVAAE